MSKYTPGPWTITEDDTKITAVHPLRKHAYEIVTIHYAFKHDQFRANAKLIAAAPDMAEALRDVLEIVTWIGSGNAAYQIDVDEALRKAYAALAKAGL